MGLSTRTKVLLALFVIFSMAVIITCLATFLVKKHPTQPISIIVRPTFKDSIIWIRPREKNIHSLINATIGLFEVYNTRKTHENITHCSFTRPPREGQFCDFNINLLEPCTKENSFGYLINSPCVFLSLNIPKGWQPEPFNSTENLPDEMPNSLKVVIGNELQKKPHYTYSDVVWLSCEGDNDNAGTIKYSPWQGFPAYFFKGSAVDGFLNPIVAIHFERPKNVVLITIECKIWGHNINALDSKDLFISKTFYLMLD